MSGYRLTHGAPLTDAQAAQLLTRTALGEPLNWAPVKTGQRWSLAHVVTLSAQQLDEHRERVSRCAQLLNGTPPAAAFIA